MNAVDKQFIDTYNIEYFADLLEKEKQN